jgi:hypothetical protein
VQEWNRIEVERQRTISVFAELEPETADVNRSDTNRKDLEG